MISIKAYTQELSAEQDDLKADFPNREKHQDFRSRNLGVFLSLMNGKYIYIYIYILSDITHFSLNLDVGSIHFIFFGIRKTILKKKNED